MAWMHGLHAVGFRLPNQDPQAIARGNAFAATADNPSAIYYNPAGIDQLEGHQVQLGIYLLDVNVDVDAMGGVHVENDSELRPVPEVYYSWSPREKPYSLGLGVYAPYGLSLKWPSDAPFRTLAQEGELLYLTVNPVVAYRIHPRVSIAAGPTLNWSETEIKQGVTSATDLLDLEGDGFAAGFNAGVMWQPAERWSFGVQYRFPTTVEYSGEARYTAAPGMTFSSDNTRARIRFPQFIVAGVSFRPTPDWNLEFNLDWTDWDDVNDVPIRNTPLGDLSLPFYWKSSFMYEFGVTRRLGKGFHASAGYFFSENSIPDRTFTPLVPDADLHLGSVGVGYTSGKWDFAFGYHFALGERTVVGGDPRANGQYDIFNQAWTVSARFKF